MPSSSQSTTRLHVEPRPAIDARLRVPGSKSLTNRALLAAALASGSSELLDPLASDDTDRMRDCLAALGCRIDTNEPARWRIEGCAGQLKASQQPLFTGNSGTTARFLTAAAALADGANTIDGDERMRERPIGDLVDALARLGVALEATGKPPCPPVRIAGGGIPGGPASIDASRSSQFVSAVLLAAPYAERDVELELREGEVVSRPYIDLTLRLMKQFGVEASWRGDRRLFVRAGQRYRGHVHAVEPDASSATYPLCAAAITGGRVRVDGIPHDTLQSDYRLVELLEAMGCRVDHPSDAPTTSVELSGPAGGLRSLGRVNMNAFPDAAMAYAVAAAFADAPTVVEGVGNLRIKETDRLHALETELQKLGAGAEAGPDWLRIEPRTLHGAEIETYDDHRMAMAFALAGLRVPGVVILDPQCVTKTWPGYFEWLATL